MRLLAIALLGCSPPPAAGYHVCPDDWQGLISDCAYVDSVPPIPGVTVYYETGGELKPYFSPPERTR